jgi:transposase
MTTQNPHRLLPPFVLPHARHRCWVAPPLCAHAGESREGWEVVERPTARSPPGGVVEEAATLRFRVFGGSWAGFGGSISPTNLQNWRGRCVGAPTMKGEAALPRRRQAGRDARWVGCRWRGVRIIWVRKGGDEWRRWTTCGWRGGMAAAGQGGAGATGLRGVGEKR